MACKTPLLLTALLWAACNPPTLTLGLTVDGTEIKQAEASAAEFFRLLKARKTQQLRQLYPGFEKFDTVCRSDVAQIRGTSTRADRVTVCVRNRYTNDRGFAAEKDVDLVFQKTAEDELRLVDSKGLVPFDQIHEYQFGLKTGCINKTLDTSDQQILRALRKVRQLLPDKAFAVYVELKESVVLDDWNWQVGAEGAFGEGRVKNNGLLSIPKLKYRVVYSNRRGDTVATDEGFVTYTALNSGQSRPFSFFTNGAAGATRASMELLFDDEFVLRQLAQRSWTGRECAEHFRASHAVSSR